MGGRGLDIEGESRVPSIEKEGPVRVTGGGGGCVKIRDASVVGDCVQTRLTCVGGGDTEPSSSLFTSQGCQYGGRGNIHHGYHCGGSCCRSQK